ncbi:myxosortase-dependent phytase-like phosphatase [Pyxidicoccus trucidator]|uniref:myxosortase-dependent phytase-like phosphatase n=1 Tax=Pyxidicoccus trucidator TaxID=2709662 RepID=UPI0013D9F6C9|nr:myxosortase-dependent phytase-like phosphatase [Pyxidicoccus trucidator]
MRNPFPLALVALLASASVSGQPVSVVPTSQTDVEVAAGANALRDVALWVNPDGGSSLIFTAYDSVNSGLVTYGLNGDRLELEADGPTRGLAVHDGFPLAGGNQTLLLSAQAGRVMAYRLSTLASDRVQPIGPVAFDVSGSGLQSVALYRSAASGRFYAFRASERFIDQFELSGADGGVSGTQVRSIDTRVGTAFGTIAGLTADEDTGSLFAMVSGQGLLRFGAEPDAGSEGRVVAAADGGQLSTTIGRVGLYRAGSSEGYLIAADRDANAFVVFERRSLAFIGAFRVASNADAGIRDAVDGPLALSVTSLPVGATFPDGLFIAHDSVAGPENLKLVSWPAVANAFDPPLRIDTRQDTDGGTDGGTGRDAGPVVGGPEPLPSNPITIPDDGDGCSCASASVPATALLGLLALAMTGRRRRRS